MVVTGTRLTLIHRLRAERDPKILPNYTDPSSCQVRAATISSLAESKPADAEAALLDILRAARHRADLPFVNAALGKVGSRAAIPVLATFIHDRVEDIKASAIAALEQLGDASTTPIYLDALSDRSWVAKSYAMSAIARRADDRAIGPVHKRVRASLARPRHGNGAGDSELIYALRCLARWQSTHADAADGLAWARAHQRHMTSWERSWFSSTFGE